jgi:uncharacterized protein
MQRAAIRFPLRERVPLVRSAAATQPMKDFGSATILLRYDQTDALRSRFDIAHHCIASLEGRCSPGEKPAVRPGAHVSRIVYLHGFASGPSSKKARFFAQRLAQLGIGLEIPDLAQGDFARLSISGQLGVIERVTRGEPACLIGSSMGGYLAALYAARHTEVEKLVLLAPAFSFLSRWPETLGPETLEDWKRTGVLKVFHYAEGRTMDLGYQLIEDAAQYEPYPAVIQPTLVFHGKNDTVVPASVSVRFAERHPKVMLRLVESDHELLNVLDDIWMAAEEFLFGQVR